MLDQETRGEGRGVLYIAWGRAHVDVARRSAASVKASNPGLRTAIYCAADDDTSGFDMSFVVPEGLNRPKVDLLKESPFTETLYLDNDTLVRADLGDLFRLLEKFELCGAHVMLWHRPRHNKVWREAPPEAFPEINCGVLLYQNTARTAAFFDAWSAAYADAGFRVDQVTFRETLWASDLRFYAFPPQFNKRMYELSEAVYSDQPRARILHLPILRPQKSAFKRWLSSLIR